MQDTHDCPDCGRQHDEPAGAAYVLSVLCLDCDLEIRLRAAVERDTAHVRRAA